MKQAKKKKKEGNYLERRKEINERLIKDRIIRNIKPLSEQEGEGYYKPKSVSNFWNNHYIGYEGNGDNNRNWSLDEYREECTDWSSKCWGMENSVNSLQLTLFL